LVDTRNLTFDKVVFNVPGNEPIANISGELSDDISFKNTVPEKPKAWAAKQWRKAK